MSSSPRTQTKPAPAKGEIRPFQKLLVANRSEIAIRIFRAGTELGLRTVAIYAQEDRFCHASLQGGRGLSRRRRARARSARISTSRASSRSRRKRAWTRSIRATDFSPRTPNFARACAEAGIIFVGPRPELLDMMGDKTAARALAQKLNVPTLPGTEEPVDRPRGGAEGREARSAFRSSSRRRSAAADAACAWCRRPRDLADLLDEAQGEAERAFGNPAVFLEKYIPRAKHIEVQILGDQHGNVLHLHERDCSVQRRHQKVIEIAPSFGLPDTVRPRAVRRRGAHRPGDRLRQRRHGRVPLRSRHARMVLHRDEPAHPGRAHGHRGHHRHRSGALADSDRAGPRAARPGRRDAAAGRNSAQRLRRSSAASPPRIRRTNSRRTTARSSPTARRAASASGSTAAWATPARSSRRFTIRCW